MIYKCTQSNYYVHSSHLPMLSIPSLTWYKMKSSTVQVKSKATQAVSLIHLMQDCKQVAHLENTEAKMASLQSKLSLRGHRNTALFSQWLNHSDSQTKHLPRILLLRDLVMEDWVSYCQRMRSQSKWLRVVHQRKTRWEWPRTL